MNAAFFLAVTALAAATAGFAAVGLAMDRHWAGIHGRGTEPPLPLRRMLQLAGAVALPISLWCCLALRETGQAIVLWCGVLSIGAWIAVAVMTYAEKQTARAAKVAGGLAIAAGLVAVVLR